MVSSRDARSAVLFCPLSLVCTCSSQSTASESNLHTAMHWAMDPASVVVFSAYFSRGGTPSTGSVAGRALAGAFNYSASTVDLKLRIRAVSARHFLMTQIVQISLLMCLLPL